MRFFHEQACFSPKKQYNVYRKRIDMNIELVKLTKENYPLLVEMLDEWLSLEDDITPYAIAKNDYHNPDNYIAKLDVREPTGKLVPDSTFFCLDRDRNIFVGAVNIRHYLNERLLLKSGHIGDGIRPSERGKGYGTAMIGLALEECRKLGIDRVLMVCDRDNPASARTIQINGGVLENELTVDGDVIQRYWIQL